MSSVGALSGPVALRIWPDIGWSTGLRAVSGFQASAGLWVVGWAMGFLWGSEQSGGYQLGWVLGLPEGFGLVAGFLGACFH